MKAEDAESAASAASRQHFQRFKGAFQLGGNTLTDRVLAVARPGFAERAGGTPCQNAREDAGFEQTRPQREMRPRFNPRLTRKGVGLYSHHPLHLND